MSVAYFWHNDVLKLAVLLYSSSAVPAAWLSTS